MELKTKSYGHSSSQSRNLFSSSGRLISKLGRSNDTVRPSVEFENVTFDVCPGTTTVILSAKNQSNSLLRNIAQRQKVGTTHGVIWFDFERRKVGHYRDIAFVRDTGIANFGSLTVFDYLYYATRLRTILDVVESRERARLVCRVCGLDGLELIAHLGTIEIRILSFAIELVANPTLLVLIDPLEGLGAAGAIEIMKILHNISIRPSMPTTVLYNVTSLNQDMLAFIHSFHVFDRRTIVGSFKVSQFRKQDSSGLNDLCVSLSMQMMRTQLLQLTTNRSTNDKNNNAISRHAHQVASTVSGEEGGVEALVAQLQSLSKQTSDGNEQGNRAAETGGDDDEVHISFSDRTFAGMNIEHGKFVIPAKPQFMSPKEDKGRGPVWSEHRLPTLVPPDQLRRDIGSPRGGSSAAHHQDIHGGGGGSRKIREEGGGPPLRTFKPWYRELSILLTRSAHFHLKNMYLFPMDAIRIISPALFLGFLLLREGQNINAADLVTNSDTGLVDRHAYNLSSLAYILALLCAVVGASVLPYAHATVHSLQAEVRSGLITSPNAWIALVLVETAVMFLLLGCVLSAILHFMVQIHGPFGPFFGVLYLYEIACYSLAVLCATYFTTLRSAWTVYIIVMAVCLIFAGFLQPLSALYDTVWTIPASLSMSRWSFEAISILLFRDTPQGETYLSQYSFQDGSVRACCGMLMCWVTLLQGGILWSLLPPLHELKLVKQLRLGGKRQQQPMKEGDGVMGTIAHPAAGGSGGRTQQGPKYARIDFTKESASSVSHNIVTTTSYTPPAFSLPIPSRLFGKRKGYMKQINATDAADDESEKSSDEESARDIEEGAKPPVQEFELSELHRTHSRAESTAASEHNEHHATSDATVTPALRSHLQQLWQVEEKESALHRMHSVSSDVADHARFRPGHERIGGEDYETSEDDEEIGSIEFVGAEVRRESRRKKKHSGIPPPPKVPKMDKSAVSKFSARIRHQKHDKELGDGIAAATNKTTINTTGGVAAAVKPALDEAPQIFTIPAAKQATLSFSRVKYVAHEGRDSEPLLTGISGRVQPGVCCCILDGSAGSHSTISHSSATVMTESDYLRQIKESSTGRTNASSLLLQVLAGKTRYLGKTTGSVAVVNQHDGLSSASGRMRSRLTAYVQRGDSTHLTALTVREALRYSAYLRVQSDSDGRPESQSGHRQMSIAGLVNRLYESLTNNVLVPRTRPATPAGPTVGTAVLLSTAAGQAAFSQMSTSHHTPATTSCGYDTIEQRVSEVISMMGLSHVADQPLQPPPAGAWWNIVTSSSDDTAETQGSLLSAAELRCFTIALELVNQPSIVFLESPLSGLGWLDAERVAQRLAALARGGRTVLCSADSPAPTERIVMQCMSDVMLLGRGQLLYAGPSLKAAEYFDNIGFDRPLGQNMLDFILDIAAERGKMKMGEKTAHHSGSGSANRHSRVRVLNGKPDDPHATTPSRAMMPLLLSAEDLADFYRAHFNQQLASEAAATVHGISSPRTGAESATGSELFDRMTYHQPVQDHMSSSSSSSTSRAQGSSSEPENERHSPEQTHNQQHRPAAAVVGYNESVFNTPPSSAMKLMRSPPSAFAGANPLHSSGNNRLIDQRYAASPADLQLSAMHYYYEDGYEWEGDGSYLHRAAPRPPLPPPPSQHPHDDSISSLSHQSSFSTVPSSITGQSMMSHHSSASVGYANNNVPPPRESLFTRSTRALGGLLGITSESDQELAAGGAYMTMVSRHGLSPAQKQNNAERGGGASPSSPYYHPGDEDPENTLQAVELSGVHANMRQNAVASSAKSSGSASYSQHPVGSAAPKTGLLATQYLSLVLVARGIHVLWANKHRILRHWLMCAVSGLVIGSIWWNLKDGNYFGRLSLFATSYMVMNWLLVDAISGIYQRKAVFLRESYAEVSSYVAYSIADSLPVYLQYSVGCITFSIVMYVLSGLRHGLGAFLSFNYMLLLSIYANICCAYLLSIHAQSERWGQLCFAGVVLPLQLILSGFLVLVETIPWWLRWLSRINPMYFYMSAVFRNEFFENHNALGEDVSYRMLSNQYDYHFTVFACVCLLFLFGLLYKTLWYFSLRMYSTVKYRRQTTASHWWHKLRAAYDQ